MGPRRRPGGSVVADRGSRAPGHPRAHQAVQDVEGKDPGELETDGRAGAPAPPQHRSEEHTPELPSRQYLVCRLLLEKKKKPNQIHKKNIHPTLTSLSPYHSRHFPTTRLPLTQCKQYPLFIRHVHRHTNCPSA